MTVQQKVQQADNGFHPRPADSNFIFRSVLYINPPRYFPPQQLPYVPPFTLMNEQWHAAKDVLVIVVTERVAVVTPGLKIHGIHSATLSA